MSVCSLVLTTSQSVWACLSGRGGCTLCCTELRTLWQVLSGASVLRTAEAHPRMSPLPHTQWVLLAQDGPW